MNDRSPIGFRLLNEFQRDFPLHPQPFAEIARQLGMDEATVMAAYRDGLDSGTVSRIGAVVAPHRVGASTLAAMAVPAERLEVVAAQISARVEVNHNYEREADWNLWFVVAAPDAAERNRVLAEIAAETGLPVLPLPLREEYHIDLGFDLNGGNKRLAACAMSAPCALPDIERRLMLGLQEGLALVPRPYAVLGEAAGISEGMAIEIIERWLAEGVIKRFGVVVRHHELGYTANAMCVWDVPDELVAEYGRRLAAAPGVTLCYRRERAMPHWRYNLYCMIHGKSREEVQARRDQLAQLLGLDAMPHRVLFSLRRFKQCGARYARQNGVANHE